MRKYKVLNEGVFSKVKELITGKKDSKKPKETLDQALKGSLGKEVVEESRKYLESYVKYHLRNGVDANPYTRDVHRVPADSLVLCGIGETGKVVPVSQIKMSLSDSDIYKFIMHRKDLESFFTLSSYGEWMTNLSNSLTYDDAHFLYYSTLLKGLVIPLNNGLTIDNYSFCLSKGIGVWRAFHDLNWLVHCLYKMPSNYELDALYVKFLFSKLGSFLLELRIKYEKVSKTKLSDRNWGIDSLGLKKIKGSPCIVLEGTALGTVVLVIAKSGKFFVSNDKLNAYPAFSKAYDLKELKG